MLKRPLAKFKIPEETTNRYLGIKRLPAANMLQSGENIKAFTLKSESRLECELPLFLSEIIFNVLAPVIGNTMDPNRKGIS